MDNHLELNYMWIHLPSQKMGTRKALVHNHEHFVDYLTRLNNQAPGVWVYAPLSEVTAKEIFK